MSTKVLAVYTSAMGEHSASRDLVNHWISLQGEVAVSHLDLSADPIPHLSGESVGAFYTPEEQRTPEQQELVRYSDLLIDQVREADVIIIASPMYNFGVPSTLKAWFDHLARAGVTFTYTENGPIGLLENKKAIFVTTRGAMYKDTPADFQAPYVKHFLSFIGISDFHAVYAEGMNMGTDDEKQSVIETARVALEQV